MNCFVDEAQSNRSQGAILNQRLQAVEVEVIHEWQVVV
jgi:hypothetical protein